MQDKSIEVTLRSTIPPKEGRSVGNTPLNLTLEDASVAKVEMAVGTT